MSNRMRKNSGQILDELIQLVARSRQQSHDFLEKYGVTVPQSGVMRVLQRRGALPIGTLAEKLFLKTSTVSGIIDRLERDGMVTRLRGNTGDRRVVHVALTDQGQELAGRLPSTSFDKLRRALDRLTPEEAGALLNTLNRLLELVREDEEEESREG